MDSASAWRRQAVVKSSIEDAEEDAKSSCVLSRKNKLTTKSQFQAIIRQSTRFVGKYIIIDARVNQVVNTRLGMTVVRRYGKAHDRNRVKRQIREAFRLSYATLCAGMDLNIRPRPFAHHAKTQNIIDDLVQLVGRGYCAQKLESGTVAGCQDS